ncbi:MAG: biotin carboxylase N-terminal domain-containing protein [Planctomycetota bacterium]
MGTAKVKDGSLRILVANRGEIARRLLRGFRAMGLETVAVYSEADRAAPYLTLADQVYPIGPSPPQKSYLQVERILEAGRHTGANAVHPGYGFLAENASFAEAVEGEGWIFIGPRPDSIRAMGDKTEALQIAKDAKVPVMPFYAPTSSEPKEALAKAATKMGFPVMLKAAAGGGGKGMRIAHDVDELKELLPSAVREAESAFGDGRIFLERYLARARHVEVQVLGDGEGAALAFAERDCSIQRRHQKLIEESPAPQLPAKTRKALHEAACSLVQRTRYRGAGTVEFLLAPDGSFYFLEMNTRLQVEHPVTEMVHGVDLVALQLAVAQGQGWPKQLEKSVPSGHAVEVRVYAENPAQDFLPSTGTLAEVVWPSGPGIRVDSGVERGSEVTPHYDPMLAKIIAHGESRHQALQRMRSALKETFIAGVSTTVSFCRELLGSDEFKKGNVYTTFISDKMNGWQGASTDDPWVQAAACAGTRLLKNGAAPSHASGPAPLWGTLLGWRMHR